MESNDQKSALRKALCYTIHYGLRPSYRCIRLNLGKCAINFDTMLCYFDFNSEFKIEIIYRITLLLYIYNFIVLYNFFPFNNRAFIFKLKLLYNNEADNDNFFYIKKNYFISDINKKKSNHKK